MFKALVFAAVMAVPVSANAQTRADACRMIGDLAEAIMLVRQDNVPMSQAMQIADQAEAQPLRDALHELIIAAYAVPFFVTEEVKARAVANFRNDAEAACFGGGA